MQADPGETAVRRVPVSGRVALIRAAAGFGMTTAMLAVVGLLWRDTLDLALILVTLGSVGWMHEADDRRSTWAVVAGGGAALLVAVDLAVVLRHGESQFSRDIACAAVGVVAGSQVYAAVTRWRP